MSATVDTPANMTPALSISEIEDVPARGTGLAGSVWTPDARLSRLAELDQLVLRTPGPDATFTATQLFYGNWKNETTIQEFLAHDGASLSGKKNADMGPTGFTFKGYVYIPAGTHTVTVESDDGFGLRLGGQAFTQYEYGRGIDATSRTAEFEGGLYEIDLSYFESGGGMALRFLIDGLPVDQSAFYQSVDDFQNPPANIGSVPVEDYHPGAFVGEQSVDGDVDGTATTRNDVIRGKGSDDTIEGRAGADVLYGEYGDDILDGGDGNDILDGGYGSDLLLGGDGDDILIARSDAGEQRIGQLVIGQPTRPDPDNEVDPRTLKLRAYNDQPLVGDDILVGGKGRDTFLIAPQINAKLDIIEKHVRIDGSINWAGVAGENDEVHDHWIDSFGIEIIADYDAEEDHIAVIGHTARVFVSYQDTDGDGDDESIITVISHQHGNGGAHDKDLIGQVIVHGDRVEEDDIETDDGVTYGVVENFADVAEAIYQPGEEKISDVNGQPFKGYDSRDDKGNQGEIISNPGDYVDNPFLNQVTFADATAPGYEETRAPIEQLGFQDWRGVERTGDAGNNTMRGPTGPREGNGLPGALSFWDFRDARQGVAEDAKGGPSATAYTLYENQAILNAEAFSGPNLRLNGEDEFAFIEHDDKYAFTQGTVAMWVRPMDLDDFSIFLSKDESGSGDGGHFRLGHDEKGKLFLRVSEGDGGGNQEWESKKAVFVENKWSHVAVSVTKDGVMVWVDGTLIRPFEWNKVSGDVRSPNVYTEGFFMQNEEPWLLGADQVFTKVNDTAQEFATDARKLVNPFEGWIKDVGIWGGFEKSDALTGEEVRKLMKDGPGTALTKDAGPDPLLSSDDTYRGYAGNDKIYAGAGDDKVFGGAGNDKIEGGYGDDFLRGDDGNDIIDGGRGSDLLMGGNGNDVLYSRSDAGEQRIGQLVLGEPSREFPDPSVDPELLKLVDWVDQPLRADDILVGGNGRDHFKFETLINGKKDILVDNLMADGRTIHWHGVAGENRRLARPLGGRLRHRYHCRLRGWQGQDQRDRSHNPGQGRLPHDRHQRRWPGR